MLRIHHSHFHALALALLLAAGPVRAQSLLFEDYGNGINERLGQAVAGGADFDLDGWDDVVVGTPYDDAAGLTDNGAVRAISGRTGAVLFKRSGDADHDHFGWSLALAGDVNADGVVDVVVGARNALSGGARPGLARVLSGLDGSTLLSVYGDDDGDEFGYSVSGKLDWDGDAFADFAVGAPGADPAPGDPIDEPGLARVFSGASGARLYTFNWLYAHGRNGESVCGEGDVDGDGVNDLVVGSPGVGLQGEGGFAAMRGGTGSTLFFSYGSGAGDRLGAAVASGLDSDGDGRDEVLVGAPNDDAALPAAGTVTMFSGSTGTPLSTWYGEAAEEHFGSAVAVGGDLDGDGRRDVLVGATEEWPGGRGSARVFGSASGDELLRVVGDDGSRFGASLSRAGDFNRDGIPDLVVGGPLATGPSGAGQPLAGLVRVSSGGAPGFVDYCTAGTSASGCRAQLSGTGIPSATAPSGFVLGAAGVEGGKQGIFFFGSSGRQAQPWGNGSSFQCVTPPVKRGGLLAGSGNLGACNGTFAQDLNALWCPTCPKPGHNFGAGALVQAQLWYRDPLNTSNQTTSLSEALEFALAP